VTKSKSVTPYFKSYKKELSKSRIKKLWASLFRPQCFGEYSPLQICISKYFKLSTAVKEIVPCKHYDDCLTEAIRRAKLE